MALIKNNNKQLYSVIIGLIILIVAFSALTSHPAPTQLRYSNLEYPAAGESSYAGPNNQRAPIAASEPTTFEGLKPAANSLTKKLFGKELFSFVNLQPNSPECTYDHSASATWTLDQGTSSIAYYCSDGQYVRWKFGDGTDMFSDLWEKLSSSVMNFDNYWVTSRYPDTYTYDCYNCNAGQQQTTCVDYDGGVDEYTQSTVHVTVTGTTIDTYYDDYCSGTYNVAEGTCNNNDYELVYVNCYPEHCNNGVCEGGSGSSSPSYQCIDSDSGQTFDLQGSVTIKYGSSVEEQKTDYCTDSTHVKEYYCTSSTASSTSSTTYSCANGCQDGKCQASSGSGTGSGTSTYDPCASVSCVSGNPTCIDSNGQPGAVQQTCGQNEDCISGQCVNTYDPCVSVGCYNNNPTCIDSNGDYAATQQTCGQNEDCISGQCVNTYDPCVSETCQGGDVYCVDSNGDTNLETNCGSGEVCQPISGSQAQCVAVDCVTNADCSVGVCLPNYTCGCNNNADCPQPGTCSANTCQPVDCVTDNDCNNGVCLSGNTCGCVSDNNCNSDSICNSGTCQPVDCVNNADCTQGVCLTSTHTCGCSSNNDCSGTSICSNEQCVAVDCLTNSDCPSGEACFSNVCQPASCLLDSDCNAGICLGSHTCGCNDDQDCGQGYTCNNYACEPTAPPANNNPFNGGSNNVVSGGSQNNNQAPGSNEASANTSIKVINWFNNQSPIVRYGSIALILLTIYFLITSKTNRRKKTIVKYRKSHKRRK